MTSNIKKPALSEAERIAKQLRQAVEGRAWHGPALLETLDGVTAKTAAAESPAGMHSIWQLVAHITTWEAAVLRWLGGDGSRPAEEENWPAISDTTEAAWQASLEKLRQGNIALREAVAKLDDARLAQPIVEGMPSAYTTLHGVVHHALYHAGQIALLKKINA